MNDNDSEALQLATELRVLVVDVACPGAIVGSAALLLGGHGSSAKW